MRKPRRPRPRTQRRSATDTRSLAAVAASLGSPRPASQHSGLSEASGAGDRRALSLLLLPALIVTGALALQPRHVSRDARAAAVPVAAKPSGSPVRGDVRKALQTPPAVEITGPTLDLAWLPRAPAGEVGVASLDIGLLPAEPGPEATVAGLDLARLPPPSLEEITTAAIDLDQLPERTSAETAVATLDLSALPDPIGPEMTVATLDLGRIEPRPGAGPPRVGYLMGRRPRLWPDRPPPFALVPRASETVAPHSDAPAAVATIAPPIDGPPIVAAREPTASLERCPISPSVAERIGSGAPSAALVTPPGPDAFGNALAEAAIRQTREFGIYDARYMRIGYPRGDVPGLYGACTDLVIRAFRAVGVDLQRLVHESRSGSGDRSIDHRRVQVLRRYLAVHGETLPVTDVAEDYKPGDIVTYYRPYNRATTSHIAIVTGIAAPSGRPMIVHNRGWGPQLEDALFADQITGHYRFPRTHQAVSSKPARPAEAPLVRRPLCAGGRLEQVVGPTVICASSGVGSTRAAALGAGRSR